MQAPLKIFLTGYAGSGKSTAGKKLARELGLQFLDLDEIIETVEKRTISEIFREGGEDTFRSIEHRELARLCNSSQSFLLACGGGTPCFDDNMALMNEAGLTVYLKATPRFLADRLSQNTDHRPLQSGLKGEELLMFVEKHLADRSRFYDQSQVVIGVPFRDVPKAADKIREHISLG